MEGGWRGEGSWYLAAALGVGQLSPEPFEVLSRKCFTNAGAINPLKQKVYFATEGSDLIMSEKRCAEGFKLLV